MVREGRSFASPPAQPERLSTGARVEEILLSGERLRYRLIEGTGPSIGWISTALNGKELVTRLIEGTGEQPSST